MRLKTAALLLLCRALFGMPVEVSHPVTNFLRRLEEKGLVTPGFLSTLPRDASEIAEVLVQARQKDSLLNSWDRSRLNHFLNEFDPVRKRQGTRLHYEDSSFTVLGGAEYFTGVYYRDSLPSSELYAFGSFTPNAQATYDDWAYVTTSATVGMERSPEPRFLATYDPQHGLPYNTNREGQKGIPQTVSTFDGFRMVAGVGEQHLKLEVGQDWNVWGPGYWQHTTLSNHPFFWVADSLAKSDTVGFNGSDSTFPRGYRRGYRYPGEGPPLPQIRLRVTAGRWEYVKLIAQRKGMWSDSAALLVAHRLQVRLGAFRLGATEILTIGTRTPEWAIFLPAVPLKFAEHAGGDLDNSALSLDAEWIWRGRGRLYGEFLLDDFSGPPLDFWGNKFSFVAGGSWQDPFALPSEWHFEYAQVDPWVYGHHRHNTAMQNYGALLGSSLPPNSRTVSTSCNFPLPWNIEGTIEWHFRQRDLKSPGSSIFDVHDSKADSDLKKFLDLDVENRHELMLSANWSWHRFVQLKGGAGGLWVDNWKGKPGTSLATPTAFGEVRFRY